MSHLHVDSVVKNYDLKQVLSDIYLSCNRGDIIGLFGRNGSGKSTLLKIIFGSLLADGKYIRIDDTIQKSQYRMGNYINYLPQHHLFPKHLRLSTAIKIICSKGDVDILCNNEVIKRNYEKKVSSLSSGERRFCEVMTIIYAKSKFTFLDEPFNGIAPLYKEIIKQAIIEKSNLKGFIITDHDYHSVLNICNRKIILVDGGLKEIKSKEDLKEYGYILK